MSQIFYKYFSIEGLKSTLEHTTRKWSSPSEFNDPFDNNIEIHWRETPDEIESNIKAEVLNLMKDENLALSTSNPVMHCIALLLREASPERRQKAINGLDGVYTQEMLNGYYANINTAIRAKLADISIFCVTENPNNLLMWSHYADHHRGGVLKFLSLKEVDSPLLVAKKVNYSTTIPSLSFLSFKENSKEFRNEVIEAFTLTKGKIWEYEKEWRVLASLRDPKKTSEIFPFAKEELSEIYLGCRITDSDKASIISIVNRKYPWMTIYQAKKESKEFSLYFEKIQ